MSDILQLGTILAVAALLFFGLGVWFKAGSQNTAGDQGDGLPDKGDDGEARQAELDASRRELAAAKERIDALEADLAKARAHLEATAESASAPAPTLGTSVDPELGAIYAVRPEAVDDLTVVRGIGKALQRQLNGLGVYRLAQIAAWNSEQIEAFSARLSFKDRIKRDDWVGQAKRLG